MDNRGEEFSPSASSAVTILLETRSAGAWSEYTLDGSPSSPTTYSSMLLHRMARAGERANPHAEQLPVPDPTRTTMTLLREDDFDHTILGSPSLSSKMLRNET